MNERDNQSSAAASAGRSPNAQFLRSGQGVPLPERLSLRAGPLSLTCEVGDLRYLKLGGREVIRRIYAAVRDRNWGTVPAVISDFQSQIAADHFHIRYTSTHRQGDIDFVWRGEITGETDGTIRFTFEGEARSTFLRNRIGFCILHPVPECAGIPCRVQYVDGRSATAAFPKLVAAEQPVKGLHDLRVMAHEVEPGVWAELSFAGAVFETEDQRNWIDASYKTFCTPLRIPYPVEVKAGTRIHQAVTLKIAGIEDRRIENETDPRPQQFSNSEFAIRNSQSSAPITITLGTGTRILPAIGTGAASHGQPLALREIKLLRRLHLTHVRLDVRFRANDWRESLARALRAAEGLECPLELALHVDAGAPADFTSLVEALTHDRSRSWEFLIRARAFKRMILFTAGARTTTAAALAAARKFLREMDTPLHELPLGGGTDADFYQLNQFRPQADGMDFVSWSMNPQVHAFDAASLAETPLAIAAQIESAKEFFPGAPLVVSPVTLKPRFNPVATGPETPTPPGELPPQVDPRQLSLFGAGWTLAALKQLAEAGVASATCFETTVWRGVMEIDTGSPLPEKFPSIPGAVFPLYHVLADIGEFAGGEVITSHSSDSLKVESLALRHDGRRALLLANLTDDPQRVRVRPFAAAVDIRRLDEANARHSMTDPEKFRAGSRETRHASNDTLELTLPPFGLARLDAHD